MRAITSTAPEESEPPAWRLTLRVLAQDLPVAPQRLLAPTQAPQLRPVQLGDGVLHDVHVARQRRGRFVRDQELV